MNHDCMHLYRRFLLLFTTFALVLTALAGPAARTSLSQEPSEEQRRRVQKALLAAGFNLEAAWVWVPGAGPEDKVGSTQTDDGRTTTTVVVGVYSSRAAMKEVSLWDMVLAKEANLPLGTDWAHFETWSGKIDRTTGSGPLTYPPAGQASVGFTCGDVVLWVTHECVGSTVIEDYDQWETASEKLATEVAKPEVIAVAQGLLAKLIAENACTGSVRKATPGAVFSIPKDLATYFYETPLPALTPARPDAPTLDRLYGERSGKLEVVFTYKDRHGKDHSVTLGGKMADMVPASAQQAKQWAKDGKTFLRSADTLYVGYEDLDKLEEIVRNRDNATQTLEKGETWDNNVLWGSELTFTWQVQLYDAKNQLAATSTPDANSQLRYTVRYPVVFVPGTGGSRLSLSSQGQLEEVWPAPENRREYGFTIGPAADFWSRVALNDQHQGQTVVATDVFRWYKVCSQAVTNGCIYELWIQHMAENGYRENELLFLFPYDWRLGTGGTATALDKLVDKALTRNYNHRAEKAGDAQPAYTRKADEKVILIGHSLGGLVARDYCEDKDRADKVHRVIQLGAPNQGTPKAVKAVWTTGYNFEAPWLSSSVAKGIARNWPGAYEQFPVTADGKLDSFLFDQQGKAIANSRDVMLSTASFAMCDFNWGSKRIVNPWPRAPCQVAQLSQKTLDYALGLRASIPPSISVPTYIIASQNMETILGYQLTKRYVDFYPSYSDGLYGNEGDSIPAARLMSLDHDMYPWPDEIILQESYRMVPNSWGYVRLEVSYYRELWGPCGDNLVPLDRLIALRGAEPIFVNGVKHGDYLVNAWVQGLIDRLLQGVKPAGEAKSTCDSRPKPKIDGVQIQASSPANLHVYDSEGRHTGLVTDGWETAIPGSAFEQRGKTQQVVLPLSASALRVVLEGTDETTLDVEIIAGDGKSERYAQWIGITETEKMRAEIQFVPSELGADTVLKLDATGDGKAVQSLAPSATSGGETGLAAPSAEPTAIQPTAVQATAVRPTAAPTRVPQATAVPGSSPGASAMPRSVAVWGGLGLSALSFGSLAAALILLLRRRKRGGSLLVVGLLALLSFCLCSGAGYLFVPGNTGVVAPQATAVPTLGDGEATGGHWQVGTGEITASSDSGDGLYLYPSTYTDVTFSAEVRADDREASLAFRMQDAQRGYLAVLVSQRVPGMNAGLYLIKRVGANEYILASSGESIPKPGEWATLSVEVKGNRIRISLNGKRLIDKVDAGDPVYASGRVGLRIYGLAEAPCHAAFRNVRAQ